MAYRQNIKRVRTTFVRPTSTQRTALIEMARCGAYWVFMSDWWEDGKARGRIPATGTREALLRRGWIERTFGVSPDTCRMAGYRGTRYAITEAGRKFVPASAL